MAKRPKKDGKYLRIAERIKESGEYELIEPLDYQILAEMQEEGTLMGGSFPLTTSIAFLKKKFPEVNAHNSSILSNRLRVMHMQGLATKVRIGGASTFGWQRTKAGKELVEKWQQGQQQ